MIVKMVMLMVVNVGDCRSGMSDWFGTISSTLKDNLSQVANTATATFAEDDSPVFDRFQVKHNHTCILPLQ